MSRRPSFGSAAELIQSLRARPEERLAIAVAEAMVSGETGFFRDRALIERLWREVVPELARRRPDGVVRLWSAGCGTGQEIYSIAMLQALPVFALVWGLLWLHGHAKNRRALKAWEQRRRRIPTPEINRVLREAMRAHAPPSHKGRQLKIYYATQVSVRPPTFALFCNDPDVMHFSYQRYLLNKIREAL